MCTFSQTFAAQYERILTAYAVLVAGTLEQQRQIIGSHVSDWKQTSPWVQDQLIFLLVMTLFWK